MRQQGRAEKSILNIITGVFGQLLSYLLSFIIRTVFIKVLGETYLGLNGLFTNILSVLSLTELGLGSAIVIELYRTVAQKDDEKTKQYLQLYKKAYYIIGSIILVVGLAITPFIHIFIKDSNSLGLINYRLVFVLYLLNSCFSYFFFAYRIAILQANQKNYISAIIRYIFKIVEMFLQVISLIIFKNIYLYLIIPLFLGCISTLTQGIYTGKLYPIVKSHPTSKLSSDETRRTIRNVFSVTVYKISGVVIHSTDNIVISSYVGIILTGLYSNYLLIVSAIQTMLTNITGAFTAGIGNLRVLEEENLEKRLLVFKTLNFLDFWIYGFAAACFSVLFKPFISFWIGDSFLLNPATEGMIIISFIVPGLQSTVETHRTGYGLFYIGRFRPVFSTLLNIGLSILFVNILPPDYGVVAVLLGTILSNLCVSWWYDAYIVFKHCFNKRPWSYYFIYALRFFYIILICLLMKTSCSLLSFSPIVSFFVNLAIVIIVYNGLILIIFHRTAEFVYIKDSLLSLLRRKKK